MNKKKSPPVKRLNATEAIYAFAAWLTTRPKAIILSSKHDASVLPPLITAFQTVHNLPGVRSNYSDLIIPMADPNLDKVTNDPALAQNQCAKMWTTQEVLDIVLGPLFSLAPMEQKTVMAKLLQYLKDQHQERLERAEKNLTDSRSSIGKESTFLADLDKIMRGEVVIL